MTNKIPFITVQVKAQHTYPQNMTYAWLQTADGWTTATWKNGKWWTEGGWPVEFDEAGFWVDLKQLAERVDNHVS